MRNNLQENRRLALLVIIAVHLFSVVQGKVPLPQLECPTYASVSEGASNCQGTFLMWGEYEVKKGFFDLEQKSAFDTKTSNATWANFGPYSCSTCHPSSEHYGYICPDYECPDYHISYTFDRNVTVETLFNLADPGTPICPAFDVEIGSAPTCIDIQRSCEQNGFGWLIHAVSVDGYSGGEYECSGCSVGKIAANNTPMDPLESPAMILFYVTIALLFVAAVGADVTTFHKHFIQEGKTIRTLGLTYEETRAVERKIMRKWWNDLLLSNLGLVNERGKPMALWMQIFKNYACSCETSDKRMEFLTAFCLSWAVAVISGGGKSVDIVVKCLFDGQAEQIHEEDNYDLFDAPIKDAYGFQFYDNHFAHSESSFIEGFDLFSKDYFVPELLAIMYLFSVSSLAKAVERLGHERWIVVVNLLSLVACALFAIILSLVARDQWDFMQMSVSWLGGSFFMFIIIGPGCAGLSWLFGSVLVSLKVLELPEDAPSPPPASPAMPPPTSPAPMPPSMAPAPVPLPTAPAPMPLSMAPATQMPPSMAPATPIPLYMAPATAVPVAAAFIPTATAVVEVCSIPMATHARVLGKPAQPVYCSGDVEDTTCSSTTEGDDLWWGS